MFKFIKQIHLARAAMLLLVALLTTGSAWADNVEISGLTYNADGYYEIRDAQDFEELATYVNAGNNCGGLTFKMMNDVTFGDGTGTGAANHTPIGTNIYFKGTFDGQEHTISGVTLNVDLPPSGTLSYVGLFGKVSGTVKNLWLKKSSITATNGSVQFSYIGCIVGSLYKENSGDNPSIENCHVTDDVTLYGNKGKIGGIAGYCNGTLQGCSCGATITTNSEFVDYNKIGGIVGHRGSGTVFKCLYYGSTTLPCIKDLGGATANVIGFLFNTTYDTDDYQNKVHRISADEYITLRYNDEDYTPEQTFGTDHPFVYLGQVIGMTLDGVGYFFTSTCGAKIYGNLTGSRDGYTFYQILCKNANSGEIVNTYNETSFENGVQSNYNKYFTVKWQKNITLADAASNAEVLAANDGVFSNVTLSGRTLKCDGSWNTLCLPFTINYHQDAVGMAMPTINHGGNFKILKNTSTLSDGTLQLNFSDVPYTAPYQIEAGQPFLWRYNIDYGSMEDIVNPVFSGVTIDNSAEAQARMTVTSTDGTVKFVGQWSPFSITNENIDNVILLGASSTLGFSKAPRDLSCFRAHFEVNDGAAARNFVLNFGDEGETTGIMSVEYSSEGQTDDSMYTLDGRKLSGKPTTKGLYIKNGRKVVIK